MNRASKLLSLLAALVLVAGACGKEKQIGQDLETNLKAAKQECRLGEKCPSPSPKGGGGLTVASPKPSPSPAPSPTERPEQPAVIVIIPEGEAYQDGATGNPISVITLEPNAILKVINKDCRPEVAKGRSFSEQSSPPVFDSGFLKCNQEWTWTANVIGEFDVNDRSGFPSPAKVIVE